jgi:hypothetical protein
MRDIDFKQLPPTDVPSPPTTLTLRGALLRIAAFLALVLGAAALPAPDIAPNEPGSVQCASPR